MMVDRRWATTRVVRPDISRSRAPCTSLSDSLSSALVASSNNSTCSMMSLTTAHNRGDLAHSRGHLAQQAFAGPLLFCDCLWSRTSTAAAPTNALAGGLCYDTTCTDDGEGRGGGEGVTHGWSACVILNRRPNKDFWARCGSVWTMGKQWPSSTTHRNKHRHQAC